MAHKMTVDPGRHDRLDSTVAIRVPHDIPDGPLMLGDIEAQVSGGTLYAIVHRMEAGKPLALVAKPGGNAGRMAAKEGNGTLDIAQDGEPVTTYHFGDGSPLPIPSKPFFHPLNLEGLSLTREVAPKSAPPPKIDHTHHRSLWVAHGDINGADIWSDEKGHGWQKHVKFTSVFSGPVVAGFTEELTWTDRDGKPLLDEVRTFRAWRAAAAGRFLDLEIALRASHGPVTLGDTKEGGICSLRIREPLQGDRDGLMTNALGASGEREIWGQRSPWLDYSGTLEGKKVGIAVFDHPRSFRYPTHWHARDYGLFTANPFAWHDYKSGWSEDGSRRMEKGAVLPFRYRIYLHAGDRDSARVASHWLNFVYEPRVEVK
jgi:hypothetical protein